MTIKYYKIANHVIEIDTIYNSIHNLCHEYEVEGSVADVKLSIEPRHVSYERNYFADSDEHSDGYLATLAAYRMLANALIKDGYLLMHGSAIAVDGQGYMFTAKSGTGKSTHVKLWMDMFEGSAVTVNDDKPIVGISDDGVEIYGTPWDGKHRRSNNVNVPLKAICILERGEENEIHQITFQEAYPMLIQQTYRPNDQVLMAKTMSLIDQMGQHVKFYRLRCNMDPEAARVSYEGMRG